MRVYHETFTQALTESGGVGFGFGLVFFTLFRVRFRTALISLAIGPMPRAHAYLCSWQFHT